MSTVYPTFFQITFDAKILQLKSRGKPLKGLKALRRREKRQLAIGGILKLILE
jgi:hypothetical protein